MWLLDPPGNVAGPWRVELAQRTPEFLPWAAAPRRQPPEVGGLLRWTRGQLWNGRPTGAEGVTPPPPWGAGPAPGPVNVPLGPLAEG